MRIALFCLLVAFVGSIVVACSVAAYRVALQRWQWLPTADWTERIDAAAEEQIDGVIEENHAAAQIEDNASTAVDVELLPDRGKENGALGADTEFLGSRGKDSGMTRSRYRSC